MALRKSAQVAQRVPAPGALDRSSAVPVFAEFTTVAGQFALNDVIDMIPWPAGTVPVMLKAQVADLDSNGTPLVTLDVGVLTGLYGAEKNEDNTTDRTCGTEFGAALTTGQAGGALDVAANVLLAQGASSKDRSIGIKVAAAPATLIAGAKIRVAALFAPVPHGVAIA
jgi:formate-dependent nitrite reductase membrane component NrfD